MNSNIDNSIVRIESHSINYDPFRPFNPKNEYIGTGSGFFIDQNHIITCSHVVSNAVKIFIKVAHLGEEIHEAKVKGVCPERDIAVLEVSFQNKYYLELGDSDLIESEHGVTIKGYPLGSENLKTTIGVISGREGNYFQTDATINSGNSGGPMFSRKDKKVIGINSSKMVGDSVEGVAYSIPIKEFIIMKDEIFHLSLL